MSQTFTIVGELAKLNEHDNSNRSNRFGGAALKKRMTALVSDQCGPLSPITRPVIIGFDWYFSSRHDFDNIAFAKKYILDGMVHAEKLPNDNQKWVHGFSGDSFHKVPKGEEKVIVGIEDSTLVFLNPPENK